MQLKLLLLTVFVCPATFASAPFACFVNGGTPTLVRVDGITELQGDLLLQCTGGTPTASGQPIPAADIQVTFNTNVTNRLITGSVTDALLLINEPYPPGAQMVPNNLLVPPSPRGLPQMLCALQAGAVVACPETGTGGNPSPYGTQPNVFLGTLNGTNSVKWIGVPLDPSSQNLTVRLTNLRADASSLGLSNTSIPTQVVASVTATGPGAPTLNNAQQTVAYIQPGVKTQASASAEFTQCADHNASLAGGSGTAAFDFNVTASEGFAQSFKQRSVAVSSNGDTSPSAAAQNVPAYSYNTETGFYAPLLFPSTPGVGLADFGSRLQLKFTNVGTGTHIFVPTALSLTLESSGAVSTPSAPPPPLAAGVPHGELRLVEADQFGVSPTGFTAVSATNTVAGVPVAEVSYTGTTAYATYEVLNADSSKIEQALIPVAVAYRSSIATSIVGVISGSLGFAPAGGTSASVLFAHATAPIPRFRPIAPSWTAYSVSTCGPSAPSTPAPANSATAIAAAVQTLSWQAAAGATAYDVYLGTSPTPPLVATNLTGTSFTTDLLQSGTTYYWQVSAKGTSGTASSPLWSFTTNAATSLTGTVLHTSSFVAGQTATFTVTVTNPLASPTTGPVAVIDSLPPGLTLVSAFDFSWNCTASGCIRSDTLQSGASYSSITFTVNVASKTPSSVVNTITISGGGSGIYTIFDPITIVPATTPVALGFFPLTPCRAADTRPSQHMTGLFGPPSIVPYSTRDFPLLSSTCTISANPQGYSLNLTAVPSGPLDFLSAWPSGQPWPGVSNLNSPDGSVIANAAILPAGTNGSISVTAGRPTDLIIDINGYFATPNGQDLAFYPVTPCRLADTRNGQGKSGSFGPPFLDAYGARNFPIANSCGVPSNAQAYSLNMTAVPLGALGFLSTWPTGQNYPGVSTLNSDDGSVIANAAIVPAGTNGSITVLAGNSTHLIIDVNGYFAPPGSTGALHFYAVPPCRVADTRNGQGMSGAFGPPSLAAYGGRDIPIPASNCDVPLTAQAYALNITAVPQGRLDFLSTWPTGQPYPNVSTLNSPKGTVLANTAIVPAGTNGAITVLAGNPTDLIIDINGYFAP